jgi:hypothetical protein
MPNRWKIASCRKLMADKTKAEPVLDVLTAFDGRDSISRPLND